MTASLVSVRDNIGRQLDTKAQPDEVVSAQDAEDSSKLSRLLTRILRDLVELRRQWAPKRCTFKDIVATGSLITPQTIRLPHRFGAAVEWSLVGLKDPGLVDIVLISEDDSTDGNTLVLNVFFEATIAIRVEEMG